MKANYLYKKIAEDIFEICKTDGIVKVMYIEICISEERRISEKKLLNILLEEIPELVGLDTLIKINRQILDSIPFLILDVDGIIKE